LSPKDFVDEVINVRIPNPFMPDTPQRIATDTSQKVGIRYGTCLELKLASKKLPVVMVAIFECIETGDFPAFPRSVVGIGHIATMHDLLREMATLFFSRGMGYIPYLLSRIFLWRKIGI